MLNMQKKGIIKEKKVKETRTIKCRKMVTKVYILGFEAFFSHFLNKNMKKII